MFRIYNLLVITAEKLLPRAAFLGEKMRLFTDGRRKVLDHLRHFIVPGEPIIWFHCASLGEYEQAVPVIRECRKIFPDHRILLTFFSPSGMEIKKNSSLGDITSYLPLDTPNNVREFLKITQPHLAVFVKYELWPNYLRELRSRGIRSLLISATFRKNQIFFKPYGSWLKRSLFSFDHIFVQDPASEQLLKEQGFSKVTLSGDTRFDRVSEQLLQDNEVEFAAQFKSGKICMVAGSTWPEDEDLLLPFINSRPNGVKFIIAPHNIDKERIRRLKARLTVKTVQYSGMKGKDLSEYEVLILDIIGYLGRVYSYGEIAYVGGAAGKTGLHNILEPAAFGIPVITGKNIRDYPEARGLQQYGGLFVADVPEELRVLTQHFLQDPEARRQAGERSRNFVQSNSGATGKIIQYLLKEK